MANRPSRRKVNQKGRNNKTARFAGIPHRVLITRAYGSLSVTGKALLLELAMLDNGSNNGSLWLSVRDAGDRLGVVDLKAVGRAFDELTACGLVQLAKDAHFGVKAAETSRARCWRLSWLEWAEGPKSQRVPCWDFEKYDPAGGPDPIARKARKRADMRSRAMARWQKGQAQNQFPVVESSTTECKMDQLPAVPVEESSTANPKNDGFPPKLVVEESSTHTAVTTGRVAGGWWQSDAERQLWGKYLLYTWAIQNRPMLAEAA